MLKKIPAKAIRFLTILINGIYNWDRQLPPDLEVCRHHPLQKPGKNLKFPSSYRPIFLLLMISRVIEKTIYKKLIEEITNKNLIPDHQFGFRQNYNTIERIHWMINSLIRAMEEKKYCTAAFLDLEKHSTKYGPKVCFKNFKK